MKSTLALVLMGVFACTTLQANAAESLPNILASALAEAKAKTRVPILLPSKLPAPFSRADHTIVDKATASEYSLSLHFEMGGGNLVFAASFTGTNHPDESPREIPNVQEVKLAAGVTGFFREVSCGGSCAPANLWWEQAGAQYHIQLTFPSTLSEKKQLKIITAVANSAITTGPR